MSSPAYFQVGSQIDYHAINTCSDTCLQSHQAPATVAPLSSRTTLTALVLIARFLLPGASHQERKAPRPPTQPTPANVSLASMIVGSVEMIATAVQALLAPPPLLQVRQLLHTAAAVNLAPRKQAHSVTATHHPQDTPTSRPACQSTTSTPTHYTRQVCVLCVTLMTLHMGLRTRHLT